MYMKILQRRVHVLQLLGRACLLLFFIYMIIPYRFAKHYDYLGADEIENELVPHVTRNLSTQAIEDCEYASILQENRYMYKPEYRDSVLHSEQILPGGEYFPTDCRARYSTAIIVIYRQRERQLNNFLIYMHNFLRQQRIHYRIFLIEQYDQKPFNRAKLFNIGSVIAAEYEFPCLVLHDVDLLPFNLGQLYACTNLPRHMCSALDQFRFNLPYTGLFGGVVAIRTEQFRLINGMSNMYEGWGGEDDDFFDRLFAHNISICRFAPSHSVYTMLKHAPEKKNPERVELLNSGPARMYRDGLNSLIYEEKGRQLHALFTHVLART